MLILLAAAQIPALRELVLERGPAAGKYLLPLLERWCEIVGDQNSPSVNHSMNIIREATRYLDELSSSTSISSRSRSAAD